MLGRSRFLQQAFESSDLEGAVVDNTPELDPVEEEQLTQEISQDEQAIEECSACLDETIDEQGQLVQQEVVAATVSEPKTEDVVVSEVALEQALAKMGTSRYREGYHAFPKSEFAFSKEEIRNTYTLTHEGIKDFLIKIGKAIKELFRKIVMFFKKLFAKLRIKLGGYSKKLDKLNEAMKNLQNSDALKNSEKANEVKEKLNDLQLASVSYFVKGRNNSPVPVCDTLNVTNEVAKMYKELQTSIEAAKKDPSLLQTILSKIADKFKLNVASKAKEAAKHVNMASLQIDNKITQTDGFLPVGCAGKKFYGVAVDPSKATTNEENKGPVIFAFGADYLESVDNVDLGKLVASFVSNYTAVKKACDETPRIFKEIDSVHGNFEKLGDQIANPNGANDENATEVSKTMNEIVKNIKQLGVDLPSNLIKCHVHMIRDYLVIGNIIVKVCGTESK